MGQIISFLLNFIFPKAETVPAQQNRVVIEDEHIHNDDEPLLTENRDTVHEEVQHDQNQEPEKQEENNEKTSSASDSNLSFEVPIECTQPENVYFEPKSYDDVAKVLDETIEFLRGKKEVLTVDNVVKVDSQLVENIIEASIGSHGSSSVATKDTKDFLFSDEKKSGDNIEFLDDGIDAEFCEQTLVSDKNDAKMTEKAVDEDKIVNGEIKNEQIVNEKLVDKETVTKKLNHEILKEKNVELATPAEDISGEISQEEQLNVVTNEIPDEQNTLELLHATLDDDKAIIGEPESNDVMPDLPMDFDFVDFEECVEGGNSPGVSKESTSMETALKEVFGAENKEFITELSYNIAKHTINNGKQVYNAEIGVGNRHNVRGSFSSMDVNMDSQDGQETLETDENIEVVENNENEFNDENADPNQVLAGKLEVLSEAVLENIAGVN